MMPIYIYIMYSPNFIFLILSQDFLAQAPSGVDTAALIHAFDDVRSADVPVFRQLLQAIAVCGNGEWTLRDLTWRVARSRLINPNPN